MPDISYLISANLNGSYRFLAGGPAAPKEGSPGRRAFLKLAGIPLDSSSGGFLLVRPVGGQMMVCTSQPHRLTAAPSTFTQAFFGPPNQTPALLACPPFLETQLSDLPQPKPFFQDGPLSREVLVQLTDQVYRRAQFHPGTPLFLLIPPEARDPLAYLRAVSAQLYQELLDCWGPDVLTHTPVAVSSYQALHFPIHLMFVTAEEARHLPGYLESDGSVHGTLLDSPPPDFPPPKGQDSVSLTFSSVLDTFLTATGLPKSSSVRLSSQRARVTLSRSQLLKLCAFSLDPAKNTLPPMDESALLFGASEGFFQLRHLPGLMALDLSEGTRKAVALSVLSQIPAADALELLQRHSQWQSDLIRQLRDSKQGAPLIPLLQPGLDSPRPPKSHTRAAALVLALALLASLWSANLLTYRALQGQTQQLASIAQSLDGFPTN